MTNKEYLEEMIHLTTRLTDACNNFGLRSPEYNAVLKDVAASAARFNRSRRRRPWLYIAIFVFYLSVTAWLVYEFLCYYEF